MRRLTLAIIAALGSISLWTEAPAWDAWLRASYNSEDRRVWSGLNFSPRPHPPGVCQSKSSTLASGGALELESGSSRVMRSELKLSSACKVSDFLRADATLGLHGPKLGFAGGFHEASLAAPVSGFPPFDLPYPSVVPPAPVAQSPSVSWEKFRVSVQPSDNWTFRAGTGDTPFGRRWGLGAASTAEIVAVDWSGAQGWGVSLGTGASVSGLAANDDLGRPVPLAPWALMGYTTAYSAVTGAYMAAAAAFGVVYCYFKSMAANMSGASDGSRDKNTEFENAYLRARSEAQAKDEERTKKAKSESSNLPYTVLDIATDYSRRMGNRVPLYFASVRFERPCMTTSLGLLHHPDLTSSREAALGRFDAKHTDSLWLMSMRSGSNWAGWPWAWNSTSSSGGGWDSSRHRTGWNSFNRLNSFLGPAKASFLFAPPPMAPVQIIKREPTSLNRTYVCAGPR